MAVDRFWQWLGGGLATALAVTAARAQPVPLPPLSPVAQAAGAVVTREAGFEFVTVGHPGNAEVPPEYQSFPTPTPGLGSVPYDFRLSRTEVTNAQYFDFVRAYAPYWRGSDAVEFLGLGIRQVGADRSDPNSYAVRPGWENAPAEMGWRFAARFCNWLQNDRMTTLDAFQTGAYDANTFTPDPSPGFTNDNTTRLPGARFFLPTQNEWMKAMYYDPNRFGTGVEGYWQYPLASDLVPVIGAPGTPGAQTSANLGIALPLPPYPIVSYPTVMGPWGIFDASGGSSEWLEGSIPGSSSERLFRGTRQAGSTVFQDRIEIIFGPLSTGFSNGRIGIRIGAAVPIPSTVATLSIFVVFTSRRKR